MFSENMYFFMNYFKTFFYQCDFEMKISVDNQEKGFVSIELIKRDGSNFSIILNTETAIKFDKDLRRKIALSKSENLEKK